LISPGGSVGAGSADRPAAVLGSDFSARITHRVAGFQQLHVQQAEEWCWAAVCLAIQRWRAVPTTLCQVVRTVRGLPCTRHGLGCLHRDCRQPERLGHALTVLGIPHRPIPVAQSWRDTLAALQADQLVACELDFEGTSHAVLLSSVTLPTEREPGWIGVDDPLPLRNERKILRIYQGGFRPTFLAAVG
jgi:hypothetical protein